MKKVLSLVISLIIAAAIMMPVSTVESDAGVRSSLPSYTSAEGKAYYYSSNNVFYNSGYGPNQVKRSDGKYVVGNCTWYAYGRASEILGKPLNTNFRWDASRWWDVNKNGNYYPYGSTPKVGAIACYSNHVAIVESVSGNTVYVSESGWQLSSTKPTSSSQLKFHYGSPWGSSLKGYIYITDTATSSGISGATNVDYSVKISVSDLNMRTGPGTGYSRIGYVKKGTYRVSQQAGNWVKLADSGYWVCASYVTKVTTSSETVVSTGTATNYQAKITVSNLNMRLGPSTGYKSKGYIKPGTYTITRTNNGWGFVQETGYWVCLTYTTKVTGSSTSTSPSTSTGSTGSSTSIYKVKINTAALHMRTGPGTQYSSKGLVWMGSTYDIKDTKNGWGQLQKNGYWIKLSYTIPLNAEYNVRVTYSDLNMRTGPGIFYTRKGFIKPGTYTISETSNGWGKVKSNGYWIKLSYTTKI